MIRTVLSSVIAIHAIIHLMGFAKEWHLAPEGRFTGKTIVQLSANGAKVVGVLWLVTCALLLASSLACYSRRDWFWIVAVAGVCFSQALIVLYWQEAKWGTIGNVVLFALIVFAAGRIGFDRMVKKEVNNLLSSVAGDTPVITEQALSVLPPVVRLWLRHYHVVGSAMPASVHIVQQGAMRTSADGEWMPFDAEQYFTVDPPGFVWKAAIHTDKYVDIVGRDKYEQGTGSMLIKVASLIPLADSRGKEIDEGSMIRYMAEMIWFPQAAVSDYLAWEEIDSTHARVTMRYRGVTASGMYTFNNDGLPVRFEAFRYRDFDGKFSKEIWSVAITEYRHINAVPIANKSEVTWKLKDGDFTWLRLEILRID